MIKTKDKILDVALVLFNQEGLANITLRRIAGYMNISQGNLNYHYKKRADIIEALYFRFANSVDAKVAEIIQREDLNWSYLKVYMAELIGIYFDYRFIFLDFSHLMRDYPKAREHYMGVLAKREEEFPGMFKILAGMGVFRKEAFPGQFLRLYQRIQLLNDFLLSHSEIKGQLERKALSENYVSMISAEIYPYLSESIQREMIKDFH
ncbi:MAG: TetR/AcrR family transcriptional regulator [Bacteroidota bacterium]